MQRRMIVFGMLGIVVAITASLFSATMVTAAPSPSITTSQGLTLTDIIAASGDQSTREAKGLQNILVFMKSGGSQEVGEFQPNLRVDAISNISPSDKQLSIQYFVDTKNDLTPSIFHCSDVKVHVFLDGKEVYVTDWFGYSDRNPALPLQTDKITINKVTAGEHHIGLIPEGRVGGCNTQGYVLSWGGTLAIFG